MKSSSKFTLRSSDHSDGGAFIQFDWTDKNDSKSTINSAKAELISGTTNIDIQLSWDAVSDANGYYVGIGNGKNNGNASDYS